MGEPPNFFSKFLVKSFVNIYIGKVKKSGGSPHFSPSKKVAQENDPTMAAYDPHFLSQNLFLL